MSLTVGPRNVNMHFYRATWSNRPMCEFHLKVFGKVYNAAWVLWPLKRYQAWDEAKWMK